MGEAKRRAQFRADQAAVAAYVALKQRQRASAAKGVATKKAKKEAAERRSEAAAAATRRLNRGTIRFDGNLIDGQHRMAAVTA